MTIEDPETAVPNLDPKARARLAGQLLESLENLSPEENEHLWIEEAARRAAALELGKLSSRPADGRPL